MNRCKIVACGNALITGTLATIFGVHLLSGMLIFASGYVTAVFWIAGDRERFVNTVWRDD